MALLDLLMQYFEVLIALALGLCFGSFATAIIYREPRNLSWITNEVSQKATRSQCPSCGHTLKWYDLVPLFSWSLAKGRCRYCNSSIGWKYPLVEFVSLLLFGLNYSQFGLSIEFAIVSVATCFLLALFVIDWDHYILPNRLVVIVLSCGVIFHAQSIYTYGWSLDYINNIVAAVLLPLTVFLLGLITSKLKGRDTLGFGDVKLFAAVGLWLGLSYIPAIMICSGIGGVFLALIWRCLKRGEVFPFGPAIIVSLYAGILVQYGDDFEVVRSYIQLI